MSMSRSISSWLRHRTQRHGPIRGRRPLTSSTLWPRTGLTLQGLEERTVPATITVTNNLDTVAVDGSVSIREALNSINAGANVNADVAAVGAYGTTDTVLFQTGLASPISLPSGQLNISSRVSIAGTGSNLLTIQNTAAASATSRVFDITDGPTTISGIRITGGNATTSGGGILSSTSVTLNGVVVTGNQSSANGGGIEFQTGAVTLTDSTVTGNSGTGASSLGGGIHATGSPTLTLNTSTVSDNTVGKDGGGIFFPQQPGSNYSGTLNITGSTISGNKSNTLATGNGGGGIYTFGTTTTIRNSTISGNNTNSAGKSSSGGGLRLRGAQAKVLIQNTTIAFNDAGTAVGGGINRTGSELFLVSSIVANNLGSGSSPDVNGVVNTADHSLLSNSSGTTITTNIGPTIIADPLLDVLASNGGLTATHNLKSGSPAIGAGLITQPALPFDQRSTGFPRTQGTGIDIGAVEFNDLAPSAFATAPNVTVASGTTHTVTMVYTDTNGSQLIDAATLGTGDITVAGPGGFLATPTITPGPYSDAKSIIVTYQFTAADNAMSGKWDVTDNGIYSINVVAGQVLDKDSTPLSVPAFTAGSFTVAAPITYTVDEVSDVSDSVFSVGKLSIREAIGLANADGAPSMINFDATAFSGTQTIILTAGELGITEGTSVVGPSGGLILDAAATSRIFTVDTTIGGDLVSLSNMTATNGKVVGLSASSEGIWDGGGVFNHDAALTLTNFTVSNCGTDKMGGGIGLGKKSVAGVTVLPSLTLIDSVVTGNHGTATQIVNYYGSYGGGISVRGDSAVTIIRSTVSGNQTTRKGGGIWFQGTGSTVGGGSLVMDNSTISGNQAGLDSFNSQYANGGGLYLNNTIVVIRNCTISGNSTQGSGGGFAVSRGTKLTIKNSTVAFNSTAQQGGGIGGGFTTGFVALESTILANNSASLGGPNASVGLTAHFSLISNTSGTTVAGSHNQLNKAAGLAQLNYYGGPTQTHGLVPGSFAIDNGSNLDALAFDQRGSGFSRQVGAAPDIGAVEGVLPVPTGALTAMGPIVTAGSTPNAVEVVYSDNTGIKAASIDPGDIQILDASSVPLTIAGVTFSPLGTGGKAVYTFAIPGGTWNVADNGKYTISLLANQVFDTDVPTNNAAQAATLGSFQVAIPIVYIVDEVSDAVDGLTGPGQLSIREAINAANADANPSAIVFDPAVFSTTKTISMTAGEFAINEPVTIAGTAAGVVLDANAQSRVFNIVMTLGGDPVSMSNITVTNGYLSSYFAAGAGIRDFNSRLTLTNCTISGNQGTSSVGYPFPASVDGGGIIVETSLGSLDLVDCTITGNKLPASNSTGAGIYAGNNVQVNLTRTTVSNNEAGYNGGGIKMTNGSILTIDGSTISGNTGNTSASTFASGGGGVYLSGAIANIRNSTISGNTAVAIGGGGIILLGGSTLTVLNCTVAFNSAGKQGGGISSVPTATINSSIVSNNTAGLGNNDFDGSVTANFSLIGDTTGATISGANNQLNVDPGLAPLASNGGRTKTHAILSTSAAYNNGSNSASLANDQRGNARVMGAAADIGAYEVQAPAKVSGVVINGGDAQRSRVTKVQVNFNQHIGFTGSAAAAFTLTRVNDSATVTLNAVVDDSGSGTAVTLTFTGGAVEFGSLADGRYALHALAAGFNAEGLDGDGNGAGGDDFFFDEPASPAALDLTKIFRLYGDGDGNGTVNQTDFIAFRNAFNNGPSAIFDFEGDGNVTQTDFIQFRNRFNLSP